MPFNEPIRFTSDASDAPAELTSAIRALQKEQGTPAQIAALRERMAGRLGGGSPPASALPAWLVLGLGVALMSAIVWIAATRLTQDSNARVDHGRHTYLRAPASAPAAQRARRDPAAAAPVIGPALEPGPVAPIEASMTPAIKPAAKAPSSHGPLPKPLPARSSEPLAEISRSPLAQPGTPIEVTPSELRLLKSSQAALGRMPQKALELAERHRRAYPDGVFAQEREVLAIEALFQLHERELSFARAKRFLAKYPDSPHVQRVRLLLERPASE